MIVKIAFTVIAIIMIAYFAIGSIYLWRRENKPINEYTLFFLGSFLLLGGSGIYAWHFDQQIAEANYLTNIVLEKSNEYTNLKNIDLSGKTIFDTYILLISEGMIENQADSVVIKEMCFDKGSQKVIVKHKNNNTYEVVPKTE